MLEEAERSLHDALCVIRCLVQKRFLVTGGASPEVEVSYQLSKWSKMLQVRIERQVPGESGLFVQCVSSHGVHGKGEERWGGWVGAGAVH